MTVLENAIHVEAPTARVWAVLAALDRLHEYDPQVTKSELVTGPTSGLGAARQCDLQPGGWFRERVTLWEPERALGFELYECTLPVERLCHRYTLAPAGGGTLVEQRMEYRLKFGPIGALLDAVVVRRTWDRGIKGFFAGLKKHAETHAHG